MSCNEFDDYPELIDESLILSTIKKMIGFNEDYRVYDIDVLMAINLSFDTLYQIGLPQKVDEIDSATTWDDIEIEKGSLGLVKNYIYLKTRHQFDPPASSSVSQAIERQIKELEWRINVNLDKGIQEVSPNEQ